MVYHERSERSERSRMVTPAVIEPAFAPYERAVLSIELRGPVISTHSTRVPLQAVLGDLPNYIFPFDLSNE